MNQESDRVPAGQDNPARDPQRPQYHFLPPAGWMNDPNGLIQWRGEYHMFYQYNPHGAFHNAIQWGHTVSSDLVHWSDLPIALSPTPGSPDAAGCFSGCAVVNDGVPTIIYSGNAGRWQQACVATSHDDLRTWQKYAGNPVIAAPPPGLEIVEFRDHSAWKEGDTWYQLIGSGIKGRGGAALLYRSPDLLHWEYVHPLAVGNIAQDEPVWTGAMWECPDFFTLGGRHVLVVSVWHEEKLFYPIYFSGDYAGLRFTAEPPHKLDFGASFYAPQSFYDATGRRIMFGWLREQRTAAAQIAAGWSGVMSLPRVLSMRDDGLLAIKPAPELEALRGTQRHLADVELAPGALFVPAGLSGATLEISAEFAPGEAQQIALAVRRTPDGSEQTVIGYNWASGLLYIDERASSLDVSVDKGLRSGPLALAPGERLRLHIFVDASVIEVFANERACVTSRVYPTRGDSLGVSLCASGGTARLVALDSWEMILDA